MRFPFAATLVAAVLGLAPAASAQASGFVSIVGNPNPYRIDLPNDWGVSQKQQSTGRGGEWLVEMLSADGGDAVVFLYSGDLMRGQDNPASVSDAEARHTMTSRVLSSDSLLYGMMRRWNARSAGEARILGSVEEIRTLAGQKAAYLRGRLARDGGFAEVEMYFTLRDGIAYFLVFAVDGDFAAHEPLFTHVRDSLVFAPAPQQ